MKELVQQEYHSRTHVNNVNLERTVQLVTVAPVLRVELVSSV